MQKAIFLYSCLAAAMLAVVLGCGQPKSDAPLQGASEATASVCTLSPAAVKEIGLTVETAATKPVYRVVSTPAKVLASQDNEAHVGSLVTGRVCEVLVKLGDYVKTGQEIMRIEGQEIGEIKAKFLSAKANLSFQEKNFERQKRLSEENVGSQKTFLESQNEYENAVAQFGAETNRISAIGLTDNEVDDMKKHSSDDRCHGSGSLGIKAPISGVIAERSVVRGQLIDPAFTAFKIINLSSVWIDGQLYEKDIAGMERGCRAVFAASSLPRESFTGALTFIGQVIDEKTRTITVRAEMNNASGKLKPQMYGELNITVGKPLQALCIPALAVVKMENTDYVFVEKDTLSFEKKTVKLGPARGDTVIVDAGLKQGERVVVKGAFYLKAELLKGSLGEGE